MAFLNKSDNSYRHTENLSEKVQKKQTDVLARYETADQQINLLGSKNIASILKIKSNDERVYEVLARSKSVNVQSKLFDTIISKSPDLLEKAIPILIEKGRKEIMEKIWEYIKRTDDPSNPKLLKSGKEESIAYLLLAKDTETSKKIAIDMLDWLKDKSVLETYKTEHKVSEFNYFSQKELMNLHGENRNIYKTYLINQIARMGDEEKLTLLKAIDRLKAYDLFWTEDKVKTKTYYDDKSPLRTRYMYEPLYSIIAGTGNRDVLLKFLDIIKKTDIGSTLIQAKLLDGAYHSIFSYSSIEELAPLILIASHWLKIEDEACDTIIGFARESPSILSLKVNKSPELTVETTADLIAIIGGEEMQKKLVKLVKIPGAVESVTKAINKYGTDEAKVELKKSLESVGLFRR
ncbi:hypothetical protein Mia14_0318 [Candidatus Mancarchaeum acidiphilum]|uniref:Uncharacterized protein n=1 Tax=Candidatus Mancarchaeum acidiphilum TaxID=1920749 RepID=A0A218NME7_9ARCH|nr:hypothetical protein [Candidatus Mancarchaeum acidiphilum]ASI13645.1 hypothetical protein Mia14_0318 [Candidatus Mancarchaeum acidiphilum]